ncbi:glycosyltransferase family 39 protein [Nocardioides sp. KIGAM211]|uniref:Glycosyltransferase family 39 protein n=1 Tax=Nocardioides luti TaxID=2761101 RepID=A0A7X0RF05_9ACTN|nr:glycosyltransferase family 39 protein [Nocardioides luti]MBB6627108.1 glycosyltransferase family 39 protein [Nocardioides luti]
MTTQTFRESAPDGAADSPTDSPRSTARRSPYDDVADRGRPAADRPERGRSGRSGRPQLPARWTREGVALVGLLVATGVLYLWGLGSSGWANSFYSAAVQAGSESWKAFFFGSSDAANSITVDKTPLSLWPMALSVKIFGLSSWSILVPQALEGVAAVALLHATVRRTTGSAWTGLLAGLVLALTPVAVLMFRFNNPDAMLVLLLIGSVYATQRALEATDPARADGRPVRWLALGGALVGLAFLTKMLQAFLVLPPLALVYVLFAAVPLRRRIGHLLVAFGAMVLAGGWWVAIVELWPAASRPYIGGSQNNSILELTLGYNGFGRLTGDETGSVGGGATAGGNWGETGILRLFDSEIGGQIAWLIPAALVLGLAGLWLSRGSRFLGRFGRPETTDSAPDRTVRAGLTVWLGWLLVTGLTFSFMAGIFHAYYTVALAPAVAALVAIGAHVLWRHRDSLVASGLLGFATAFTTAFAFFLLDREAGWLPWLKYAVATLGLASALMIAGVRHLPRRVGQAVAAVALVASLAGPTAYSLATAATPHTGSIPTAGPSSSQGPGGAGGPGGAMGTPPGGTATGTGTGTGTGTASAGGLLEGSTSSAALTEMLQTDASSFTWVAAAVGSNSASGYQLASEEPVMAIGGFNGSDPSPTLAQFQQYVADGEIHYFIAGGGGMGGGPGGSDTGTTSEISAWVEANFTATTVDGVTVYDLSTGVQ